MAFSLRLFIAIALLLGYCRTAHAQITITSVSPNSVCAGSTITITYNSLQFGTVYAYLHDANSTDFGTAKHIQTISGGNNLIISIPIASSQAPGNYTVRLTNSTPFSATYTTTSSFTITAAPLSPTVNNVSYCQWATASPLSATASTDGTLNWYGTSATGGTASPSPITPSTIALSTTNYYVSQTINGCESLRSAIIVSVNIPTTPTVISVSYCQNSPSVPLVATSSPGGTLNWYTTPLGGTPSATAPTPPTSFAGSINYYVSQTVNGCEGPRAAINVTIRPLPTTPSVNSLTYCQGNQARPLIASVNAGGNLRWYTTLTGGTGSVIAPIPQTSTPGLFTYYVSQAVSGCEGPRASINITVNPNPTVSIDAGEAILTPSQTSLTLTATSSASALSWSTGEIIPTITVNTAGIYSATVTADNGCSAIATVAISQSSLDVIYSVKSGGWDDPAIWSTNQIPTSADAVRLRHTVSLSIDYQAQAGLLSYDAGGQLNTDMGSHIRLGTYD